jgi:hypothetical protein
MGINFFFTFPTSEGSDLFSLHVMQTPTFISKLSDGNVIFRLDVGKNIFFLNPDPAFRKYVYAILKCNLRITST